MRDSLKLIHEIRVSRTDSTVQELEGFIGTRVHKDFINEIIARIELLKDYYQDQNCDYNGVLETRGGIEALKATILIFEMLLENRKSDDKHPEEKYDEKDI